MERTLDERTKEAFFIAKAKIFIKLGIFLVCCIAAAIICSATIRSTWAWLFPALLSLFPIGLGLYYAFLIKRDLLTHQIMQITEKKKARMEGLLLKNSLSQKRYTFEYRGADGMNSFSISRGGVFNTMKVDQTYLVLFNSSRPAGEDNFIEFTTLETSNSEKKELFDTKIAN